MTDSRLETLEQKVDAYRRLTAWLIKLLWEDSLCDSYVVTWLLRNVIEELGVEEYHAVRHELEQLGVKL